MKRQPFAKRKKKRLSRFAPKAKREREMAERKRKQRIKETK